MRMDDRRWMNDGKPHHELFIMIHAEASTMAEKDFRL
jgi:hypothetical protein